MAEDAIEAAQEEMAAEVEEAEEVEIGADAAEPVGPTKKERAADSTEAADEEMAAD